MFAMQQKLLEWYELYGRHDLPWRNTADIYHIYLSEVMLQQTQVSRVQAEYYPKFLDIFPTLQALAYAPLEDVLAHWSGLGYYTRANNLHKTAKMCAGHGLPECFKTLQTLPGIGKYTASAICSFGYNQNVPVVDTNISRVLKRFFAIFMDNDQVWKYAAEFLNQSNPKHHNLALMDLGSLICTPKNPQCTQCPLFEGCLGKDMVEFYTTKQKKQYEDLELFYGVYIQNNMIALVNATGSMYKNMLELPMVEPIEEDFLGTFKHSYTKYRLQVNLYQMPEIPDSVVWADIANMKQYPISSLTKKALMKIKESNI